MQAHLNENGWGTLGGAIGAIIAKINLTATLLISWEDLFSTVIVAAVGGVIGFYVQKFLKWLHK